jgi:hypothetical protein
MIEECNWAQDENGVWDTAYGGKFEVLDGTPCENSMNYCPYCGKAIHEKSD